MTAARTSIPNAIDLMVVFIYAPRATDLEQHRDVENEPAVVVDHGAPVDDTAAIAGGHDDEFRLEVHGHGTDSPLPPDRQVAATVVMSRKTGRQRTIVRTVVVANDD